MDQGSTDPPLWTGSMDHFHGLGPWTPYHGPVSQRFGHPRVLGIPIPKSLAFWTSPVGDAQNADPFDFA